MDLDALVVNYLFSVVWMERMLGTSQTVRCMYLEALLVKWEIDPKLNLILCIAEAFIDVIMM